MTLSELARSYWLGVSTMRSLSLLTRHPGVRALMVTLLNIPRHFPRQH